MDSMCCARNYVCPDSHTGPNVHAQSYSDSYCYIDPNADCYADADHHTDANCHLHTDTYAYTHTPLDDRRDAPASLPR